ncbi:MAG: ABC transporter permease, partial [Tetragenococcus halophilus]|nr:ABC transporter permease [Tetragenococcus halophilus]
KMVYMIGSIILMFAVTAGVGMGVTEIVHNNLSGNAITEDVEEAAAALDRDPSYVRDNLYMIKDDDYALQSGADARGMDETAYGKYLDEAMKRDSLDKASDEITDSRKDEYDDDDDMDKDDIEITTDELADDPGMILNDSDALQEGSKPLGMNVNEYRNYVNDLVDENENEEDEDTNGQMNPSAVLSTAKEVTESELDVSSATVDDNMNLMKNDNALEATSEATDVPEDQLSDMIDESMVSSAIDSDEGTEFDLETFGWLILGSCLLTLAMGSISFFASTLFNRTNAAMAVGGGLPLAFYIVSIVIEQNDNLEDLKYITITTLYNTSEIIADGDFLIQMGVLAVIPVVLYTVSGFIFTRKDLPL